MARPGLDTARRMVSAYAEEHAPWKSGHDAAMECRDLEDSLCFGNAVFAAISELKRRHTTLDPEVTQLIEDCYRFWMKPCPRKLSEIDQFERDGFVVEGAGPFRLNCAKATEVLMCMDREAAVEARVGFRNVTLTPEAAEQLERILENPSSRAPRPTYEPQSIPLADASILLRD
jgi:hypothetical protein